MGRRTNGEGTYDTLPSGRVRLRVRLPDASRATFLGSSRQDCHDQYLKVIANQPGGRLVTSSSATLAQWLDQWLSDHVKPNSADSPRTYEAYESCVRLRLKPELGHYRLAKLRGPHIQRAYAHLSEKYAPKTMSTTHEILHRALKIARLQGLITHNPSEDVTPPKRPERDGDERALSREQLSRVDQLMVGHDFEPHWRFLLGAGVRWGEAAGLTWSDVDLAPGREHVRVVRAATKVPRSMRTADRPESMRTKAPKTRKGRRTIPLPPDAVAALHVQHARTLKAKLAAEPGTWITTHGDLVFPNQHGGLLRSNKPLEEWQAFLEANGLPHKTLHDLRHTYATLLFARGVHPRIAQDLLGHARIDMTLDTYTSSVPEATREAVSRLADVFERPAR
jgi:integrase